MNKSLYEELTELRYISINELDPLETPDTVVLYFNNLADTNTKISIESIYGAQLDLLNQNPTIELENNSALVCLAPASYTPVVTIDPIPNYLDPSYPVSITFTGTISITDTHIPGDILVTYSGITKKAFLETNTTWTVTYSLREVTKESLEKVTAIANSIDINNPEVEGEFSSPVEETFKILFTIPEEEPECVPVTNKISCLCLDITKNYKVTVDEQSITGTFEEVVTFLDSHGLYAYPSETECNPGTAIEFEENTAKIISVILDTESTITPKDIFILQDVSGSFEDEISVVKSILRSLLLSVGLSENIRVGFGTFSDFVTSSGIVEDFPFKLDMPISNDLNAVATKYADVRLFHGGDTPESQLYAIKQTIVNPLVGWDLTREKHIIVITDAKPHTNEDDPQYPSVSEIAGLLESSGTYCHSLGHDDAVYKSLAENSGGFNDPSFYAHNIFSILNKNAVISLPITGRVFNADTSEPITVKYDNPNSSFSGIVNNIPLNADGTFSLGSASNVFLESSGIIRFEITAKTTDGVWGSAVTYCTLPVSERQITID